MFSITIRLLGLGLAILSHQNSEINRELRIIQKPSALAEGFWLALVDS